MEILKSWLVEFDFNSGRQLGKIYLTDNGYFCDYFSFIEGSVVIKPMSKEDALTYIQQIKS